MKVAAALVLSLNSALAFAPSVTNSRLSLKTYAATTDDAFGDNAAKVDEATGDSVIDEATGDVVEPEVTTVTAATTTIDEAAVGASAENAVKTSTTVALDLDKVFGVSVETGGKCTPLGKLILQDTKPQAVKWFQNAEIKHGRIAMVAVIGFMVQKFGVHFPLYLGPTGSNAWSPISDQAWYISKTTGVTFSDIAAASPLDAVGMVPTAGWVQIFFVAGWFESLAYERQWNQDSAIPGDYGYDPLGFTKREGGWDSKELTSLRLKEIKNGRVAMLTIAAWVADEAIPGAFPFWRP